MYDDADRELIPPPIAREARDNVPQPKRMIRSAPLRRAAMKGGVNTPPDTPRPAPPKPMGRK